MPEELYNSKEYQYTHAIVEDETLFMSGQVGFDRHGELPGSDIESQTRRAFENIGYILDHVEKDHSDIVKLTTYIVDIHEHYDEFKSVYGIYFEDQKPCHTMIGVDGLATEEILVELEAEVNL